MQLQELTYLMQHPEVLNTEQTDAIKKLVDTYPYFQPARAIYLKGLKNKESFKYNNALKVTAAYTTDRSILFDYITSEVFNQNAISEIIKHNSEYLKDLPVNASPLAGISFRWHHSAVLSQPPGLIHLPATARGRWKWLLWTHSSLPKA